MVESSGNWKYINIERGRKMSKKYTAGNMIFDMIMTLLTGGFWLIWVLIRYLRTH